MLRQRARALDKSDLRDPLMQRLIDDMIDTMHEYYGVGLAAPQVHEDCGCSSRCSTTSPVGEERGDAVVNPEIVPRSRTSDEGWEGCLSIPDIRGMVPRYTDITRARARPRRQEGGAAPQRISRRAWPSTRPTTSTACCSSIA